MQEKYFIQKAWGETPLEALERLRTEENIPADVPMTYAGRLDPAAEGLLIVLTGEECKKKQEYNALSKTYVAEILFGVSTDSYDLLGLPVCNCVIPCSTRNPGLDSNSISLDSGSESGMTQHAVDEYLKSHTGKQTQAYPPYSSKTVDGVQLHTHTKEGNDVELPTHEVELISYTEPEFSEVGREEVIERVNKLTGIVKGDFRQTEIAHAWNDLKKDLPEKMKLLKIELKVSSGFYIRQLAEDIGKALGGGACLYSLVRTEIK